MRKEALSLIKNKLAIELADFDNAILGRIREQWNRFSPAVNCPTGDEIAKELKSICSRAYREREVVALKIFEDYLSKFGSQLDRSSKSKLMDIAKYHFPNKSFYELASKTEEVFLRRNAPKLRLNKDLIQHTLSLIEVDSINVGRRTLGKIAHCIDEHTLLSKQSEVPTHRKVLSQIGNFLVLPAVKWIFSIIGLVIVAAISYRLGFNG